MTHQRYWHGLNTKTNPFGFGCWQIAGVHTVNNKPHGWGTVNESDALDILCCAMENEITFFDTAQGYNFGKSEHLLGEAIRQTGKKVVVCTKIPLSDSEIVQMEIGNDFLQRLEKSLENLKSNRIDILLIHNPPDEIDWKLFNIDILNKLEKEGTIGTYGVSATGLNGAKNAIENKVGTTLEWVFNLFERRPISELFPLIESNKMNFIARSPFSRGLLNSKYYDQNPNFKSDDYRSTLPKEWVSWIVRELRSLKSIGIESKNIPSVALNFIRSYQQVNAVIPGIRSMEQLNDYLKIRNFMKEEFKDFKKVWLL